MGDFSRILKRLQQSKSLQILFGSLPCTPKIWESEIELVPRKDGNVKKVHFFVPKSRFSGLAYGHFKTILAILISDNFEIFHLMKIEIEHFRAQKVP